MQRSCVPDGGWGWMVVLGAAVTNMVNQSLFSQFGLIYGQKLEDMGHGTVGAALAMNVNSMVTNFSGLLTGTLLSRYSTRTVTLVGTLLTATGMILSSVATSLGHLILTYSILAGLGMGLLQPSTFVAVNSYFKTRKTQAIGLAMAGTGVGQMLMPQLVRVLLDEFGYEGTTLILGALCLNGVPGALLFHPVKWHMQIADEENELLLSEVQDKNGGRSTQTLEGTREQNVWSWISETLDLNLLMDPTFVHIILGLALVYTCSVAFSMLFPFFLQEGVGFTRADTALCMSLLSGADILSRLTLPMLTTSLNIGNRMTFVWGAAFLAVSRSFLAEQTTFRIIVMSSLMCGYIRAATVINQNLTISEYCMDKEGQLPAALGLNMIAKGLVVLSVGQLLGWIRDAYDSFTICIHAQNAVLIAVVCSWSIEIFIRRLLTK